MKKIFFILFPFLFLFNGCIEIVEEITINADKSGTASFYIDLGSLGGLATSLGENYLKGTMLDELKKLPETAAGVLKNVKGLSNVVSVTNKKGLYSVSFNFQNSKQLNAALYKLFYMKKPVFAPNYLKITTHKLKKKNYAPIVKLVLKKYKDQLKDVSILKKITYKSISNLPTEVKRYSNKKSTLSPDKKTVEVKCSAEDFIYTSTNIGNKIRY